MGSTFKRRPGASKNVPYLSHEFIIQNHGDIITCVFMVFIVGLMFQVSAPLASLFVAPAYNVTEIENSAKAPVLFTYGLRDISLTFFYTLSVIIFHAVIQEYVLDKMSKKVRLSKTKTTKFNESGQLIAFYIISLIWLVNQFIAEGFFQSLNFFWSGYPHVGLTFWTKMLFIVQISYWVHVFPELYFQKVKKEDMAPKITNALVYLFAWVSIYVLNFSRIGLTLMFIDYVISLVLHIARMFHFMGRYKTARVCFKIFNISFVLGRLLTTILALFVFWSGFSASSVDKISLEDGNFNTKLTRLTAIGVVLALQTWMLWNFIMFQCKKRRENARPAKTAAAKTAKPSKKVASSAESSDAEGEAQSQNDSISSSTPATPVPSGKVKAN